MAFCGKCGSTVADGVAFCPSCGAPAGAVPASGPVVPAASTGLQENVAALLAYVLGWLTGIIFLLVDKRPFVRFHAAQSVVVFGSLFILRMILLFGGFGSFGGFFWLWGMVALLISLLMLVLWVVLMIQAYQGKWFELPLAGPIAKNIAGSAKI
jgi:uncharacterized membrane protein